MSRDPLHPAFWGVDDVRACVMTHPCGWGVRARRAQAQVSPHTQRPAHQKDRNTQQTPPQMLCLCQSTSCRLGIVLCCTQCTKLHKHHGDSLTSSTARRKAKHSARVSTCLHAALALTRASAQRCFIPSLVLRRRSALRYESELADADTFFSQANGDDGYEGQVLLA